MVTIYICFILDQFFLCNLVVLESICCCTRAKRLVNDSKTTGGLRKIWTGLRKQVQLLNNGSISVAVVQRFGTHIRIYPSRFFSAIQSW